MPKVKKVSEKALQMHELLLSSKRLVVCDIETTGFSPDKGGRIIEVAGVKIENDKIVDTYNKLINPEQKIYDKKIIELTGITNEMLVGKPVFGQVLPEFYQFIGDAVFVAHNAMFDWDRYLSFYFKKVGIIAKNSVICTRELSKIYFPYRKVKQDGEEKAKGYDLKGLCADNGILIENHHRALADSEALARLLLLYKREYAPKYVSTGVALPPQPDLFGESSVSQMEYKEEKEKTVPTAFKVKRVSYWEKAITKQKKMQRIYVLLSIGSVYFDIPTKTWYNKDVLGAVNFEEVNQRVLSYLKMSSKEELCLYRNSK
ncbi:3'-5' exonuclease (plasmid) [Brevibacillus halotolerans]|nr:3'-5' exonuclease [Brevibacillus halotolerans]